jgi:hypothetical protein
MGKTQSGQFREIARTVFASPVPALTEFLIAQAGPAIDAESQNP